MTDEVIESLWPESLSERRRGGKIFASLGRLRSQGGHISCFPLPVAGMWRLGRRRTGRGLLRLFLGEYGCDGAVCILRLWVGWLESALGRWDGGACVGAIVVEMGVDDVLRNVFRADGAARR